MKTVALLITLALHSTGLWQHLPADTRAHLTTAATSTANPTAAMPQTSTTIPISPTAPIPIRTTTATIDINATSAFAVDAATGTVLYAKNPGAQRPIASVTKMATAIVILSRHSPAELVKVPTLPNYQAADELIGLVPGETYTVGNLIKAALIPSANDAADALALADSGTIPKFAAKMNAKMSEWGITGTHFSNPTGLQDTGNFATAEALAKIGALAITNPVIRQTVSQPQATIASQAGRSLDLTSTDDLLATGHFYGIKTGYTPAAGECFVGLTRIQGHDVITVVLNAGDRFAATQTLANWIANNWQWL